MKLTSDINEIKNNQLKESIKVFLNLNIKCHSAKSKNDVQHYDAININFHLINLTQFEES